MVHPGSRCQAAGILRTVKGFKRPSLRYGVNENPSFTLLRRSKTFLVYLLFPVLTLILSLGCAIHAQAWVEKGHKPFPDGRAPIIIDPFCKIEDCHFSKEKWQELTRKAIAQWNNADVGFTFLALSESPSSDPCHTYDVVSVIVTDGRNMCPGDRPMTGDGATSGARVYINMESIPQRFGGQTEEYIVALLVHEFGHVMGLGHPDEAGQQVSAIMNSNFGYLRELQPDDIAGARALYGGESEPEALVGFLGNPRHLSSQSGIGVVSGWVCEAETVEIEIAGESYLAAYGTERLDTAYAPDGTRICGDTDNGFGLLVNWNRFGEGEHTVVAFVDGVELGRATITVTTLGAEFPRGLEGEYVLDGFPDSESAVVIRWEESLQNFVIIERRTR